MKIKQVPANNLQMIVFNWVCIDKYDILLGTGNNGNPTMTDMISKYPLHAFSYIKSFAKTNQLVITPTEHNCHNMITNPIHNGSSMCHVYGDSITHITQHTVQINEKSFKWGFILHLNTRSLANALTKSLVTQLRRKKQITDLEQFKQLVNNFDTELALKDMDYKNKIMEQFNKQLNLKWLFPIKVRNYHESVKHLIHTDSLYTLIKSYQPALMTQDICQRDIEFSTLRDLCTKSNVDWAKCHHILELFV
jgi:hypothetical protein